LPGVQMCLSRGLERGNPRSVAACEELPEPALFC